MTPTVGEFYDEIDRFAPFSSAEPWDNVGLLIGGREQPAGRVLFALDLTGRVLDHAMESGAQLVITHHPLFLQPLSAIPAGSLPYRAVAAGLALICAHTNLDLAEGGVNTALAGCLGLENSRPLQQNSQPGDGLSLGRVGELPAPLAPEALAARVGERLGAPGVRLMAGAKPVKTVAVCGGSGGDLLEDAVRAGAQALVTGDVKHHQFLAAAELGLTLIDAGHFETETVVMEPLRRRLAACFPDAQTECFADTAQLKYVVS